MASFGPGRPRPLASATRQFFLAFRDLHHYSRNHGCWRCEPQRCTDYSISRHKNAFSPHFRAVGRPSLPHNPHSKHNATTALRQAQARSYASKTTPKQKPNATEEDSPSTARSKPRWQSTDSFVLRAQVTDATESSKSKGPVQDVSQEVVPPKPLGPVWSTTDTVLAALAGEERGWKIDLRRKRSVPKAKAKDQSTSGFYTQEPVLSDAMRQQALFEDAEQTVQEQPTVLPDAGELEAYNRDRVIRIMRRVPQPLAVVTSLSAARLLSDINIPASDIKGMTLSSVDSITIDPTPFISFNSKVPSATFSAIVENPNSEFTVHILRGNSEGAYLAHAFATGTYTEAMIATLRIQAHRTLQHTQHITGDEDITDPDTASHKDESGASKDEFSTNAYPNRNEVLSNYPLELQQAEKTVFATLHCRLVGEKCVQVGDHILAVAEVTHAMKHKKMRGSSGASLYYYNKKYYGQSDRVKSLEARPQDS